MKSLLVIFLLAALASADFQESIAKRLLFHSLSTNCPAKTVETWSCQYCNSEFTGGFKVTNFSYAASVDTQAYVGFSNERQEIVVSFQGTDPLSIKDWLDDIDIIKADLDFLDVANAKVHSGFLACYFGHRDVVVPSIQALQRQYPNYTVWVTGHSLGGAQAIIAALDLVYTWKVQNLKAYTFGCPRVGNGPFALAFNKHVPENWRLTHERDPVPHVPPKFFGFHHPGTEVWNHDNGFKKCDGSGEDSSCSDSLLLPLGISDHLSYLGISYLGCYA